jgi:hypothetical protein
VSTRIPEAAMADQWFHEAIVPLTQRHQELAAQSIRRKTAHLAELVASYLQTMVRRSQVAASPAVGPDTPQMEAMLAEADNRIAAVASCLTQPVETGLPASIERTVARAATDAVAAVRKGAACSEALVAAVAAEMAQTADGTRQQLEELARTLEQILRKLSQACGGPENLSLGEAIAGFTPLPRADERRLSEIPQMRCSRVISRWSGLALWLVRRRAMRHRDLLIWPVLRDHRDKVQAWLKENLEDISNAYEAYVALFRDQLRQVGERRVGFEDAEHVQADLEMLRDIAPAHATSLGAETNRESECVQP